MEWMKKGDNIIKVGPKQRAHFEKRGYKPHTPPVEETVARIRSDSNGGPSLKPGQVALTRGGHVCIADSRQVPTLLANGWSDGSSKQDPADEQGPSDKQDPADEQEPRAGGERTKLKN